MKQRIPILRLFSAIERRDDDARTIEGICYAQADAGDGFVLAPDVMRAMTPDYLKFANLRVMHRSEAVGTTTVAGVTGRFSIQ